MAKKKVAKAAPERKAAPANFTLPETLRQLEALGDATVRAHNAKNGAGENQFGVKRGYSGTPDKRAIHLLVTLMDDLQCH